MHSRVFQISLTPLSKDEWCSEEDLFDDLVPRIADYVVAESDEERGDSLNWLENWLNLKGCAKRIDENSFKILNKEAYFQEMYSNFLEKNKEMSQVDLAKFSDSSFLDLYYRLKETIDDEFGFYICFSDQNNLITMDEFMRYSKDGDRFYVGATFDYHF